jgi:hypothetical protein
MKHTNKDMLHVGFAVANQGSRVVSTAESPRDFISQERPILFRRGSQRLNQRIYLQKISLKYSFNRWSMRLVRGNISLFILAARQEQQMKRKPDRW